VASRDHGDPGDAPSVPPPLNPVVNSMRPSAAEEARTIAASTNTATLASLTAAGDPWGRRSSRTALHGGAPVLCLSNMAEQRPQPRRRSAGQPVDRRARNRRRSARQRAHHAGPVWSSAHRGDEQARHAAGTPRWPCPPPSTTSDYGDLHPVGAARAPGPLGGRLRPDGLRHGRGLRRSPARSGQAHRQGRHRAPQRRPRAGLCWRWHARLGGYPDTTDAHLHRRRPLWARPAGDHRARRGPTPESAMRPPIDSMNELRAATVELAQRAREG